MVGRTCTQGYKSKNKLKLDTDLLFYKNMLNF